MNFALEITKITMFSIYHTRPVEMNLGCLRTLSHKSRKISWIILTSNSFSLSEIEYFQKLLPDIFALLNTLWGKTNIHKLSWSGAKDVSLSCAEIEKRTPKIYFSFYDNATSTQCNDTFIVFIWSHDWRNFLILEKFIINVFSRASFLSLEILKAII